MTAEEITGLQCLRQAFDSINIAYISEVEGMPKNEICYTKKYEKSMSRLIENQKHSYWKFINTVGKRVAIIAVIILSVCCLSMSVSAIREPVVEFFTNVYEKFTEIIFGREDIEKAPETIETVYTLGYVPEGYEMSEQYIGDYHVHTVWTNSMDERIELSQMTFRSQTMMDSEKNDFKVIYLNGKKTIHIQKNQCQICLWNDLNYCYSIRITGDISINEVAEIIRLVEKVNTK